MRGNLANGLKWNEVLRKMLETRILIQPFGIPIHLQYTCIAMLYCNLVMSDRCICMRMANQWHEIRLSVGVYKISNKLFVDHFQFKIFSVMCGHCIVWMWEVRCKKNEWLAISFYERWYIHVVRLFTVFWINSNELVSVSVCTNRKRGWLAWLSAANV